MKQSLFIILVFASSFIKAQLIFQTTYGGANTDGETSGTTTGFASTQQTFDGGYIIATSTTSFGAGGNDVYVVRINSVGTVLWSKAFGGNGEDYGFGVQQCNDGGFIVIGTSYSFTGYCDAYLIKIDSVGNTDWIKIIGDPMQCEQGISVQQSYDGGYILTGISGLSNEEVYLAKTDSYGNLLWSKSFGGSSYDEGWCVKQTQDSGYVVVGRTLSFSSGYDIYLIKTDSLGSLLWSRTFGKAGDDLGFYLSETFDGGLILTGTNGGAKAFLLKTDSAGNKIWAKQYGGTGSYVGHCVKQTPDNGFIIAGYTNNMTLIGSNVYLIKTDSLGTLAWSKTFGGTNADIGYSVDLTTDGGYALAGWTKSFGTGLEDIYFIKADANGSSGCNEGNPTSTPGSFTMILGTPATVSTNLSGIDTTTATTIDSGSEIIILCSNIGVNEEERQVGIQIYPNPTSGTLELTISEEINKMYLFDISGEQVMNLSANIKMGKQKIDLSKLNKGVYILKISTVSGNWLSQRIILD